MVLGDDKTDDDDEQPDRGDERDRKRDGDQHFDGGDRHVPIDVDNFPDDRRIPAARLVVDGPVISPALTRRPSPGRQQPGRQLFFEGYEDFDIFRRSSGAGTANWR
jgi:hypothetical protein